MDTEISQKAEDCIKQMVEFAKVMEGAKEDYKTCIDAAFKNYSKKLDFGDQVFSKKNMKKIAEAIAKESMGDLDADTKELCKLLVIQVDDGSGQMELLEDL